MRTKVTLVLLFLNVALFFFIFQFERRWRTEDAWKVTRTNVLGAETADIRALEIAGGNSSLILKKTGDTWMVTRPLEWPANPNAVGRILTELQFLKHETSFNVSDLAKNGQSLADYGLDQPRLTVTITSGDPANPSLASNPRTTRLRIGDLTKDGLRLYVLSPDGERIHVVSQSLARSLALGFDDLRGDALFTIPVFEARSLNLQTAAPANLRIRLRRDGSRWSFETPVVARASKTETELAINALNKLEVASFITTNPPTPRPTEKPSLRITLEGNNRRETLILGDPVPVAGDARKPGITTFYAQLEGRNALFTVNLPSGAKDGSGRPALLETLQTAQVALRDRHVLDFDAAAVNAVTLAAPNQPDVNLQRLESAAKSADAATWQIIRRGEGAGPQTLPADRAAVTRLLDQLTRLTAAETDGFKSDAPTAADLETWGFNRPEREVTLTFAGSPVPVILQLGTDSAHRVYARLGPTANPGASVYAVDADILRELPVAPRAWRDRLLRELPDGARLTALKLTDLNGNQVLLDTPLDATGLPAAVLPAAQNQAVAALLKQLHTLRAKEFLADQYVDKVTVAGEERAWHYKLEATATLVGGSGEQTSVTTLFLSPRLGGDLQVAGSPAAEFNTVFAVEQAFVDALWVLTEGPRDPGPAAK
ncbi:MAG TPA: DUF4340 domain-containing protein [Opitutaceae bacterium]|nr:DUF4340 domain-containing protein [Opitutaceae bacterium]